MDIPGLIKAIQRQFGDETGAMVLMDDIFRWINEGQLAIFRRTGDSDTQTTIALAIGDYQKPLPADFFKVKFVELDGKKLQILGFQQLYTLFPDLDSTAAQQNVSKYCAISNTGTNSYRITFAPRAGQAGSATVLYQRRPPVVVSTDDVLSLPEEYHSTLLTYCLAKAKQLDGDDQAAAALNSEFKAEVHEDSHDAKHKDEDTYPIIRASWGDYC